MQSIGKLAERVKELTFRPGSSLRDRVLSGGAVTLLADVYSHVLRLVSNLVMTRLLYPEAFGLMLIVNLVFTAFFMLSDVGIRGAIITKKGELSDEFINTAWTIGVLRGLVIGVLGLIVAWPMAQVYNEPILWGLIAVASLGPALQGFTSVTPTLYEKDVRFVRVVYWGCLTQTITLVIVLLMLYVYPSVWVLVITNSITAVVRVTSSYILFDKKLPRFCWSREAVSEIYKFGRWVVIATALTFFARQGDVLIVSHMLTTTTLGVFSIAVQFAKICESLVEKFSWSLLLPVYSELRESGTQNFRKQLTKVKLIFFALCSPLIACFALFGRDLIGLLYDPRYYFAGYMLEILAFGSVFFVAGGAVINIPMSFGDSKQHMLLQALRFSSTLLCMFLGAHYYGLNGLLFGTVVAQAIFYPIVAAFARKYDVLDFRPDLLFAFFWITLICLTWWIRGHPFQLEELM